MGTAPSKAETAALLKYVKERTLCKSMNHPTDIQLRRLCDGLLS